MIAHASMDPEFQQPAIAVSRLGASHEIQGSQARREVIPKGSLSEVDFARRFHHDQNLEESDEEFEVGPMVECCHDELSPARLRRKVSRVPLILREKMECDFAILHSSALNKLDLFTGHPMAWLRDEGPRVYESQL